MEWGLENQIKREIARTRAEIQMFVQIQIGCHTNGLIRGNFCAFIAGRLSISVREMIPMHFQRSNVALNLIPIYTT